MDEIKTRITEAQEKVAIALRNDGASEDVIADARKKVEQFLREHEYRLTQGLTVTDVDIRGTPPYRVAHFALTSTICEEYWLYVG
jgi:hypothetical protein